GPRFVQHEVADRAEDADLVARSKGREGALVRGVREADRVFEVRARGSRREGHGARVHPPSVCSWRNVNCVGPNVKAFGFSTSIAWVVGVSGREDTTRLLKPRGGPANPRPPMCLGARTRLPYFVTMAGGEASHNRNTRKSRRV